MHLFRPASFVPILLACIFALSLSATPSAEIAELVRAAGNTPDEMQRLTLLRQLSARTDLEATVRGELENLLPLVESWADGKSRHTNDHAHAAENGYLCWFIGGRVKPATEGAVYPLEPHTGSPLHPLWAYYRGRMLIWRVIQSGPLLRVPESRDAYYSEGRRLLEEAALAFPENRVIRMYLGQPIPWPAANVPDPRAPEWANLQREGLEKLSDIIRWWIAERQLPDGQFGGGWGDDVEMWRWWTPVLIAFQDPVVEEAQERISNGIFAQPHLQRGFTTRVTDVEHSNEDTTDTILPMMHLRPDDPVWRQRALKLTELMRDVWTGRNERGLLQFKSVYFSIDRVDESPRRAFDTVYHPTIVQPTLLYWQRTGDPELTRFLCTWLDTWVDAAAREENGKPAGVLPSALAWPAGTIGAPKKPWWEPFPADHNDALYNWPGSTKLMSSTLLLAWHMSGDEKFLAPLRSMAAIRSRPREKNSAQTGPGSLDWTARRIGGFLPESLAKYRFLSGNTQFDDLLQTDASGYVKFRLKGDRAPLVRELEANAGAFRSNREAYTSEMRWTDRVMAFTRYYLRYLPEPPPTAPTPELLYSSATGDPGDPLIFPMNAVRWLTPPRDIAALVTASTRDAFAAELYHFGDSPRSLQAELLLLQKGTYEVTLIPTADGSGDRKSGSPVPQPRQTLHVTGPRAIVAFELPARELCVLRVTPSKPETVR